MGQKGFYFDMENCIGCSVCQIACKDKNQLEVGTSFREITTYEGGKFPNPWVSHVTMSCNHCGNPICADKCPTGAMFKREEDGVVDIRDNICIGCKRCIEVCPFNGIKYLGKEKRKVGKCNLCFDITEKGEEPACVAGCLMRVLKYGEIKELKKLNGSKDTVSPINYGNTNPSYIIKTKNKNIKY